MKPGEDKLMRSVLGYECVKLEGIFLTMMLIGV
jgi:hypothetical protein